ILDDGNYLPSDQYLLVYKGKFDNIANVNETLLDPLKYELDEEQLEHYEEIETRNGKNNYLLSYFKHEFKRGGDSKKTTYKVIPKISREVNEFVLDIKFQAPKPKEKKKIGRAHV